MNNEYVISKIKNDSFSVQANRNNPVGLIFTNENKNFLGYLLLHNGFESIPLNFVNDSIATIDFGTLQNSANIVKPKFNAKYVWFECADGYTTSLPLEDLSRDDIILAHKLNDQDLSQPLGGPVRLVVPEKYAYKSPMWIIQISFIKEKRLGYWESGIYSDTADVWKNDRYR